MNINTNEKFTQFKQTKVVINKLLKLKKEGIFSLNKIPISLKGSLKGIIISDKEIKEAKKSLFKI